MILTPEQTDQFSPYFDQEQPQVPVEGIIADLDLSELYELDAVAVFKTKERGYLVVYVNGCSCWPDYGSSTTQYHYLNRINVIRRLHSKESYSDFSPLIDKLQAAQWKINKP